jgi:hypothetical protein
MRVPLLVAVVVSAMCAPVWAGRTPRYAPEAADAAVARPLDEFELDGVSRSIPARGRFTCPDVDRVRYRGTAVRFQRPVTLARPFVARVARFEAIVAEVARRVYGRAPARIRHLGGTVCRRMKTFPELLSEHAIGDAIDIEGFDFERARRGERTAAPRGLRGAFQVRIERHWNGSRGAAALHARFLRQLADELIAQGDLFRVMLGPSYPGHGNHLHLDTSTFRMIEL